MCDITFNMAIKHRSYFKLGQWLTKQNLGKSSRNILGIQTKRKTVLGNRTYLLQYTRKFVEQSSLVFDADKNLQLEGY